MPVMIMVAMMVIAAVERSEGGLAESVVVSFGTVWFALVGMVMFRRSRFSFKGASGLSGTGGKQRGTT
ncbi:MAG: hypothetical protein VXY04_04405 [Pseudomonadota bacterium]|uniref:hypothetical protein n=2 Tax=Qipengyuania flava TaxID=192812 RepID=UPI000AF09F5B|nr:hypothetical protein [Qipengyuania flava]MEC8714444.1 hypothetical protein [Pseudomonadota bacterium]MEC9149851.1 hypothetical protein [Pseudomonadota bacterium]|tara:strand:+ start:978 stop:1181 length:204 start_codon:yes stop_codon:yes gene_type:complete